MDVRAPIVLLVRADENAGIVFDRIHIDVLKHNVRGSKPFSHRCLSLYLRRQRRLKIVIKDGRINVIIVVHHIEIIRKSIGRSEHKPDARLVFIV